jgi:two-component system response regulator VicR
LLGVALRLDGFRVIATSDSGEALQMVRDERPALVVLDIMMPGVDGYTVCQMVRSFSEVPIVMLTAKSSVDDIARGLDLGADDCVVKPFNVNELVARVKGVLRRTRLPQETQQTMSVSGDLVIDYARRMVRIADREMALPPIEYRLLCLLATNAGKVITYGHLLTEVWGPEYHGEDTHILEAAIARLRRRLGDGAGDRKYIATRRGIGYYFNASSGSSQNRVSPLAAV